VGEKESSPTGVKKKAEIKGDESKPFSSVCVCVAPFVSFACVRASSPNT
jgi:hypothetical protein